MFRSERQEAILTELSREGRVATQVLAERFGVSEDSIRKDLQQLDAQGKAQRVYGGAVSVDEAAERKVSLRIDDHRAEKAAIARKAYELIEEGQTIYLDVSSTNLYLADELAQGTKHVTVVSNMLEALLRLAGGTTLTVQCPGGTVNSELTGLVGALAVQTLEQYHFDAAFLGTLALDVADDAVSTFDMEDGVMKSIVLKNSRKTYLVADSHKFHEVERFSYAHMSDFTALISDKGATEFSQEVAQLGLELKI